MSNQDNAAKEVNPNYTSQSETERVFDIFNSFKQDTEKTKLSVEKPKISNRQPLLDMSSIRQLGKS